MGQLANIGPKEQTKRRLLGIVFLLISVTIAVVFIAADVDRWWRLVLVIPLWIAGLGLFQAREKT